VRSGGRLSEKVALLGLGAWVAVAGWCAPAQAGAIPRGALTKNVEVVGYTDVDGRPPFKMAIQEVGGKWYLYTGHLWNRGWSILDVTDPAAPRVVNYIVGPANTWTIQMEVNSGKMVTALERIAAGWGGDPDLPFDEGVLI